jgi:hypothetical protein
MEVKMAKKINLEETAAGGLIVTIEDGSISKHINLTPGELAELGPRLATLAEDASLKIKQKELEENDQIPDDDDVPDSEPDDNDFIPD